MKKLMEMSAIDRAQFYIYNIYIYYIYNCILFYIYIYIYMYIYLYKQVLYLNIYIQSFNHQLIKWVNKNKLLIFISIC